MESIVFPISSASFFDCIFVQSERLSVRDLLFLFEKAALGGSDSPEARVKCSIRPSSDSIAFCIPKNDAFLGVAGAGIGSQGADTRAKVCKKLLRCILEKPEFRVGSSETGGDSSKDFEFPMTIGTEELSRLNLDQIDRKALVGLKKKVLDVMLGGGPDSTEKGRPIGGTLVLRKGALGVQLSPEQAVSVLKKTLFRLSSEKLVELDSKLGGAITTMPAERKA